MIVCYLEGDFFVGNSCVSILNNGFCSFVFLEFLRFEIC